MRAILADIVQPGDILGTEGHVRVPQDLWPPWDAVAKWRVYSRIRQYQRIRRGHTHWRLTHVRLVVEPGRFFEWTAPRARFGELSELAGKRVTIFRPERPFDHDAALAACQKHSGEGYDYKELVRFAAQHWPGYALLQKIIGQDRADRYVCSTGAAMALAAGGYPFPWDWRGWCPSEYGQPGSTFSATVVDKADGISSI